MNQWKGSFTRTCAICSSPSLALLWDLPNLPLTEKFGPFEKGASLSVDQQLLLCEECGHVQLGYQIDPQLLYTPTEYAFRVTSSKTAIEGTHFFHRFFLDLAKGRTFRSLLDVGGNGLMLAKMTSQAKNRYVVDPVCAPQHGQTVEGVKLYGGFIETFDFEGEGVLPDLVFSRHVFEHISKPKEVLQHLLKKCDESALLILEIPCLDQLVEAGRFDAIFHQHYHYYDLSSLRRLLYEVGAEYIDHRYNPGGPCGGALLIAFQKAKKTLSLPVSPSPKEKKKNIQEAISNYQAQMAALGYQLSRFHSNIYGYGAGLMLATLGYHLKTDFSELVCILDDDPQKDSMSYQNIPVTIRASSLFLPPEGSNYLVTSMENLRVIYQAIANRLKPRRILVPLTH